MQVPGRLAASPGYVALAEVVARHAGPEAVRLIGSYFGAGDPESPKVLAAWRKAGFPLGNHGYSHRNLDQIDTATFTKEVADNEASLSALMSGSRWTACSCCLAEPLV